VADRTGADSVVAIRERPGTADKAGRTVHLALLPTEKVPGVISTLCGAQAALEKIVTGSLGAGLPCDVCLSYRDAADQPIIPDESAGEGPTPAHRRASAEGYAALGSPVITRSEQTLLIPGDQITALLLPIALAERTTRILAARARPTPVLTHPDAPQHQILITGEPYGAPLPWPAGVLTVIGHLPLPPARTPQGAVEWVHLPDGHALTFCREIDLINALHYLVAQS